METILLFTPLVGALVCGFGHKILGEKVATVFATALLFLTAALSWIVFLTFDPSAHENGYYTVEILRWIQSGSLDTSWQFRVDRLTAIMLIVITSVSSLVHLYSFGYMDHDPQWKDGESYKPRFFAYLSFFTFAMLMLVTADNLVQMFFGWEGVGVASYLLIGFYYKKPSANAAAIKAFSGSHTEAAAAFGVVRFRGFSAARRASARRRCCPPAAPRRCAGTARSSSPPRKCSTPRARPITR